MRDSKMLKIKFCFWLSTACLCA